MDYPEDQGYDTSGPEQDHDLSLAGAVGLIALGAIAPAVVKGGARRAISSLARNRRAQQWVRQGSQHLDDIARRAGTPTPTTSQLVSGLRSLEQTKGLKARAMAVLADTRRHSGGHARRVNLTRTLTALGARTPQRLQQQGQRWMRFRQDPDVKRQGVLTAMLRQTKANDNLLARHGGQARLLKSAAADWARHAVVEIPAFYAIDHATGAISGPGERPAAWDLAGHAEQFVRWLPTYAGLDIAGRMAFGLPKAARSAVARATDGLLTGQGKAAGTVYAAAQDLHRRGRNVAVAYRNRYNHLRAGSNPVTAALTAAEQLSRASRIATQHAGRSTPHGTVTGPEIDLVSDLGLRSAYERFGPKASDDLRQALRGVHSSAKSAGDLSFLTRHLKAPPDRRAPGLWGHLFKAKAVTVGEVEDAFAGRLTKESERMLSEIKSGLESFQQKVRSSGMHREIKAEVEGLDYRSLHVHSVVRTERGLARLPTGEEARLQTGRLLERVTSLGRKGSLFGVLHGRSVTDKRPAFRRLHKQRRVGGEDYYFQGIGEAAQPDVHNVAHGLEVAAGGLRTDVYGVVDGAFRRLTPEGGQINLDFRLKLGRTTGQLQMGIDPGESVKSEIDRTSWFDRLVLDRIGGRSKLTERYGVGDGSSASVFHRASDLFGRETPRRLFGDGGAYWNRGPGGAASDRIPDATGLWVMRQALKHAGPAYNDRGVFGQAVGHLTGANNRLAGHSVSQILTDDVAALRAARQVLNTGSKDPRLRSPTEAGARHIIDQYTQESAETLYNLQGRSHGDTLRQFLFEHGALTGQSRDRSTLDGLMGRLDKIPGLSDAARTEAKAGLLWLRARSVLDDLPERPYEHLLKGRPVGTASLKPDPLDQARAVLSPYRGLLGEFARSRPLVDTAYHRRPLTELIENTGQHDAYVSVDGGLAGLSQSLGVASLDTTRKALGLIGLGWDPGKFGVTAGKRSISGLFTDRALLFGGAALGLTVADTAADIGLPDGAPLSEGLFVAGADVLAGLRTVGAHAEDTLGITSAAQYLEGLMPKSTSILPGVAAGYALGGRTPFGMIAGGVLNRMSVETFRDTPVEALSAVPGLGFFVSDVTETSDDVQAKYRGEEWVPVRKGRGFLLSTTDFAGGRIEQWRPNWYSLLKGQPKASPALYGSKLEQAIFRDIPILDVSVGDLFDPDYLTDKHYYDRPYVSPDFVGSEFPVIGPQIGRTFGQAFSAFHPAASTGPMHMENVVGAPGTAASNLLGGVATGAIRTGDLLSGFSVLDQASGEATAAFAGQIGRFGHAAYGLSGLAVAESDPRAAYDEMFYRMTEALGFTGFLTQQAVGGEGIFRDAVAPSASRMGSTGRAFHDLALGDLLGAGEAIRRLYPFERDFEEVGPRNTMPGWIAAAKDGAMGYGDPYCLAPWTTVEVDGHLIRADDAYELVDQAPGEHTARTHYGRSRKFIAAARRHVSDELVEVRVDGLPWSIDLTPEHPVLVYEGAWMWRLAGQLEPGDLVMVPPTREDVVQDSGPPLADIPVYYDAGHDVSRRCDGLWVWALPDIAQVEPRQGERWNQNALDAEALFNVERAFAMPGSKKATRDSPSLTEMRREMAEHGFPLCLTQTTPNALRALVERWGDRDADGHIHIALTPERLGMVPRPEWTARDGYPISDTALRDGAYTLWRALSSAGTPARLKELEDGYDVVISGEWANDYKRHHQFSLLEDGLRRSYRPPHYYLSLEVVSCERVAYDGYVYAFQVEGDESFVAGGVATHNSKVMMGEALLPGAGYEAMGGGRGRRTPEIEDLGEDTYETALNMLGISGGQTGGSWARDMTMSLLMDTNMAVREQAVVLDEASGIVGVADAMSRGGQPITVTSLSSEAFAEIRGSGMAARDRERLNALMGASRKTTGMAVYVDDATGQIETFVKRFDRMDYRRSISKLEAARNLAEEYAAEGYGAPGALYSAADRLQVLVNADPFGDAFRTEARKAKALAGAGLMDPGEEATYDRVMRQQDLMGLSFEIYPNRFRGRLLDPDPTVTQLNFNENIKAAAHYSLPERMLGAGWESLGNLRSPLHSRFFGTPDVQSRYETEVLLSRSFQSWNDPVQDFLMPYARGLRAADDPLQGATSFGVGAAVFGGGAWAVPGAVAGAAYGALHGAYRAATGTRYVPGDTEGLRQVESSFDRLRYHRASFLYEATGSQQYRDQMGSTVYGWVQQGLSETGWAKDRRPYNTPEYRHTDPLFRGDLGFGSPWRGLARRIVSTRRSLQRPAVSMRGGIAKRRQSMHVAGGSYTKRVDVDPDQMGVNWRLPMKRGIEDPLFRQIREFAPSQDQAYRLYKQFKTPEFTRWNSGNTLRNKRGGPVAVFHGAGEPLRGARLDFDGNYTRIMPGKNQGRVGVYFSKWMRGPTMSSGAEGYARIAPAGREVADPHVYIGAARLRNPAPSALTDHTTVRPADRARLEAQGYDGSTMRTGGDPYGEVLAYRPDQVKLFGVQNLYSGRTELFGAASTPAEVGSLIRRRVGQGRVSHDRTRRLGVVRASELYDTSTRYGRYQALRHVHARTGDAGLLQEAESIQVRALRGLPDTGFAPVSRARHRTLGNPDRGFASPYGGLDHVLALGHDPENPFPQRSVFPPEIYTAFKAAPRSERKFLGALLAETNAQRQAELLQMVSPDMAAVLQTSWAYLGTSDGLVPDRALSLDPMAHMALGAMHPAMAPGADIEGFQIRTMEDVGLDTHEAGVGWKSDRTRLDRLLEAPSSLASAVRGDEPERVQASDEIREAIVRALRQMGIKADVVVDDAAGPTEIHFVERT